MRSEKKNFKDDECIVCGIEFSLEDMYFAFRIAGMDFNMCEHCKVYSEKNKMSAGAAMQDNIKVRLKSRGQAHYLRFRDKVAGAVAKLNNGKNLPPE